ncbi:MAG: hypothetical protein HY084_09985 [Gemmatimonadetes bacterium]|nr:hypothetical protein [Gemmatimonadota bacterium]
MILDPKALDVQGQRERRWSARLFLVGVSVAVVALLAVACRDVRPTEGIMAVGLKPKPVCFSNPDHTACICPPGTVGTWPNCSFEEAPPVVTGDTAKVWCTPHTLTRGDSVGCRIYVGRQRRFRIIDEQGRALDAASGLTSAGQDDSLYAAGDTARWSGSVVVSTIVTVKVSMADSTGRSFLILPVTADTVNVQARTFAQYALANPAHEYHWVEPQTMTPYPAHYRRDGSAVMTFGRFKSSEVGMFTELTDSVANYSKQLQGGPNDGLSYIVARPPIRDTSETWVHPGLYGGLLWSRAALWYRDQSGGTFMWPGTPPGRVTKCDANGVRRLRSETLRHEGLDYGGDSHYQRLASFLLQRTLPTVMERTVVKGSIRDLRERMRSSVDSGLFDLQDSQSAWENEDYPRVWGARVPNRVPIDSGAIQCFVYIRRSLIAPPPPLP